VRLTAALQEAGGRGFRKLLALGSGTAQATVAVIPLAHPQAMGEANVMLLLSRCGVATPLAAEAFARSYGLTSAETRVLLALCNGKVPQEIARDAEVEIPEHEREEEDRPREHEGEPTPPLQSSPRRSSWSPTVVRTSASSEESPNDSGDVSRSTAVPNRRSHTTSVWP